MRWIVTLGEYAVALVVWLGLFVGVTGLLCLPGLFARSYDGGSAQDNPILVMMMVLYGISSFSRVIEWEREEMRMRVKRAEEEQRSA